MKTKFQPYLDTKGDHISQAYIYDTWVDGDTVGISAGTHGNEHAWVKATADFKEKVEQWIIPITKWKIVLILKVNEEALSKDKRFLEDDGNRVVNWVPESELRDNYEQRRWKQVKAIMDNIDPDHWLDLHTVSAPNAKPYLFAWMKWYKWIAQHIGVQNIAIDWHNIHKSKWKESNDPIWQWVADYANYIWANGLTLEAWSHDSPDGAVNSYQAIVNMLLALWMTSSFKVSQVNDDIDNPEFTLTSSEWIHNIWWENKSNHVNMEYYHEFKWGFEYRDDMIPASFTSYKKDEVIGYDVFEDDSKKEVRARFDGYIILPKNPEICIVWKETFCYGRDVTEIN